MTHPTKTSFHRALLVAAVASGAIVGCKKKEEAPPPPPEPAAAPAATPAPPPAARAATASVVSVDLGTAVGPDLKLTASGTTFKPKDTIYAVVGTTTSDPAATVPGKLGVKWTFDAMNNGKAEPMTVNEESKDIGFTGAGATEFHISKPDGFPVGKYKVDVMLDGNVVQTKEFTVAK
ncbi:MAG: hypothetical protein ACTHOH_17065 [Lysobacteraceae bacterium]